MAKFMESLDGLMGRILDLDAKKIDIVADTTQIHASVNGGGKIRLWETGTDMAFALNDHMRGQIATDLSIPKRYFDRMTKDAPHLAVTNVNHWLQEEPNRRMIRAYREPDSTTTAIGRAWVSDRYRRLDHIEIARTLLPEFEGIGAEFHQAAISDEKLYIRALFPGVIREVKVGDPVQWGVEIRNSEVGSGSLSISGFINRLVCTNGMTVLKALNVRHVGKRVDEDGLLTDEALRADDTAFWLAARDILKGTIQETRFDEIVAQLRETTEGVTVQRPIKATEVLAKNFSLSEQEREQVLTHLVSGGDLSRWGALNALTAAAKSAESVDRQVEMEGMGWDMALVPAKQWESIALAS